MDKYILIKVDTNDGDYIEQLNKISQEKFESIFPVIELIKENDGDYSCGEMGDSGEELYSHLDGYNAFDHLCPRVEYGFHTIESIEIYDVSNVSKLY